MTNCSEWFVDMRSNFDDKTLLPLNMTNLQGSVWRYLIINDQLTKSPTKCISQPNINVFVDFNLKLECFAVE